MKKRIVSFLLALTLALALLPAPGAAASGRYSDVPAGHWAAETIYRATELGLFRGSGDGTFGLGRPITRAEFVTALARFFGWESAPPARPSFSDVPAGSWYFQAVETALANGAIPASGTAFRPGDEITRADMVEMLLRGMGYASLAGQVESLDGACFTDVAVKKGFITAAYDMGIVSGVGGGRFAPDSSAAREEAAAVLVRAWDRLYAKSLEATSLGAGDVRISVATPVAEEGTDIPITPLEPLLELYSQLRTLRNDGQDMSRVVLCLTGGGVRTIVSNGRIVGGGALGADEVRILLALPGVTRHYSRQYESAYFLYQPNAYQTAVVWYQSPESIAAKLQLARLFGVTRYILV